MIVLWLAGMVMLLLIGLETTVSYWINKEVKKESNTVSKGKEIWLAMRAKLAKKHVS